MSVLSVPVDSRLRNSCSSCCLACKEGENKCMSYMARKRYTVNERERKAQYDWERKKGTVKNDKVEK